MALSSGALCISARMQLRMSRRSPFVMCMRRQDSISSSSSRQPIRNVIGPCRAQLRQESSGPPPFDPSEPQSKTPLTDQLYNYLLLHTREPPILKQLREETAGMHGAQMQIPPEQGPFMSLLTEITGTRRAIEVGVFTGYSSLSVAMALPDDGLLVACDKDDTSMTVARRYWKEAGVSHKIQERLGDGIESLQSLLEEGHADSFDMAFIDANKRAYIDYYELLLKLVRPGGLIIADNVLFYGKVANPEIQDKYTQALRDFNTHVMGDERVSMSIIPVGDGMALCRKRQS